MSKIVESRRFLGRTLGPLLKAGLPLIQNVLKSLVKIFLMPLGLTATALKKILNRDNKTDYFKQRHRRYHENGYTSWRYVVSKTVKSEADKKVDFLACC